MKQQILAVFAAVFVLLATACSPAVPRQETAAGTSQEAAPAAAESAAEESAASSAASSPAVSPEAAAAAEETAAAKDLVVYFSWSGNTRQVAQAIQQQTGADIFELVPVTAYPESYDETLDVAQQEKRDGARPAFDGEIPDFDSYERVFVGFPNWWGDMPMILYTFFDTYDLGGKTLAPFVTSSSSGFSGTRSAMETLEPGAQMTEGLDIRAADLAGAEQSVTDWLAQIG